MKTDSPDLLTLREQWANDQLSETAQAPYALEILKKHFAGAGLSVRENEQPPATWWSFCLILFTNLNALIGEAQYQPLIREMFKELVELAGQIPDEYFVNRLLEMIERFIDRDPPRSIILPLLPPEALEKMNEIDEIRSERHEEYMRLLDQMSY